MARRKAKRKAARPRPAVQRKPLLNIVGRTVDSSAYLVAVQKRNGTAGSLRERVPVGLSIEHVTGGLQLHLRGVMDEGEGVATLLLLRGKPPVLTLEPLPVLPTPLTSPAAGDTSTPPDDPDPLAGSGPGVDAADAQHYAFHAEAIGDGAASTPAELPDEDPMPAHQGGMLPPGTRFASNDSGPEVGGPISAIDAAYLRAAGSIVGAVPGTFRPAGEPAADPGEPAAERTEDAPRELTVVPDEF